MSHMCDRLCLSLNCLHQEGMSRPIFHLSQLLLLHIHVCSWLGSYIIEFLLFLIRHLNIFFFACAGINMHYRLTHIQSHTYTVIWSPPFRPINISSRCRETKSSSFNIHSHMAGKPLCSFPHSRNNTPISSHT